MLKKKEDTEFSWEVNWDGIPGWPWNSRGYTATSRCLKS
jgi:hypothetical protein